jgi:hypothetical protein
VQHEKTAGEKREMARLTGLRASLQDSRDGERDPRIVEMPASVEAGEHFCADEMDIRSSLNIIVTL